MAHNIFGERFLGNREPAWHGLGNVFTDSPSAEDAFQRAGLLYRFVKQPLFYESPAEPGVMIPSGKVALLRSPTPDDDIWREVNQVNEDFGVIQNDELAKVLDAKIYQGKSLVDRWPLETAGALGQGETIFATLKETDGTYQVKGDTSPIERFFLVSDGKGGDHALRMAVVHLRVVCQNTLDAALAGASLQIRFSHHENVAQDFDTYVKVIAQLEEAQAGVTKLFQQLAETTITDAQAKSAIKRVYAEPETPAKVRLFAQFQNIDAADLNPDTVAEYQRQTAAFEKKQEHMAFLRAGTLERYHAFNSEQPGVAQTPWALFNAVSEVADNRRGSSARETAGSILFGERARERQTAFKVCADLAGIKLSRRDEEMVNAN